MFFFKKKNDQNTDKVEIEFKVQHEHTWKDMPWYMEVWYNTKDKTAGYSIIEPYICITCGKRKDVTLETLKWTGIEVAEREEEYKKLTKKYAKYLKPRAVVEDMINNILLVKDPMHLEMMEKMRGTPHSGCGTSSSMDESDFQINIHKEEH